MGKKTKAPKVETQNPQPTQTPQSSKNSEVIKPLIRSNGALHVLEKIFDGDPEEIPEIKSVGFMKVGLGAGWISYTMVTRGREVISIEVSEPDLRELAEESAKIAFVTTFVDKEF